MDENRPIWMEILEKEKKILKIWNKNLNIKILPCGRFKLGSNLFSFKP
jgi:hypothetical protein